MQRSVPELRAKADIDPGRKELAANRNTVGVVVLDDDDDPHPENKTSARQLRHSGTPLFTPGSPEFFAAD
jgi:hypothetical protein